MGAVKKVNSFLTMESENYEGTMGIAQNILLFHLNMCIIQTLCQTFLLLFSISVSRQLPLFLALLD